ncbi:Delta(12) fatty acid desaturase [Escovopsis weberi]|uniref:Delta(12) fatty acid desaturase n=1 Tax=Escovopsis weberi TaxID=150374 RepID=A0A0M9VVP5_ESCWE|nr:Delta(12) fatty acid desaturase [Escovopsis weberi]
MAPSTALDEPQQAHNRNVAAVSTESSAVNSPLDSPRPSASSTSLSSLSEAGNEEKKKKEYGRMLDTYGNEFTLPDYTVAEVRAAIPKHCFERSALTGYYYILRDIACISATFYVFHNYATPEYVPNVLARASLWAVYTFLQGLFGTGLWVIAHECGHGAFSESSLVNNVTGWVLHSSLLVPYFSWQISHRKHHASTGNMERDMVFVPRTREEHASRLGRMAHELADLAEETPIVTLIMLVLQQLVGWPNYLMTNVTGHNYHERQREGRGKGKQNGLGGGVNHFDPTSPLYEAKDAKLIVLSDIGIALVASALFYLGNTFGWANLAVWYFIPYFWVNHWLVAITFLQHTDPTLPHYKPDEWNYVRGSAATIDREFGFIGRQLLHGIVETHVCHHYIATIPFYHADEATEAIRKVMGKHYRSDTAGGSLGFLKAMWTSARMCQWVEPTEGATGPAASVLFFRNRNGLGVPPAKMKA